MDDLKQQPEEPKTNTEQPVSVGVYGPNDKPKGKATVVADEPVDIFPTDNGDLDKPTTPETGSNN